ncbi:3-dehydroquinate synthase II, partial [Candidatus Bathyarchaeota archaeon]
TVRELWVIIKPSLSSGEKENLIREASKVSTTLVVEPEDIELTRARSDRMDASRGGEPDILIVETIEDLVRAKEDGRITCFTLTVKNRGDEEAITEASESSADYVMVRFKDWKVIPLENLIAKIHGKSKLLTVASDVEESRLALETLEIGTDGIVVDIPDIEEINRIYEVMRRVKTRPAEIEEAERIELKTAEVVELKPIGSGARVCIDTCDLMREGEGLLVGCQSSGLFLVEAEVHKTPFVAPRPFRVNAGPVALYTLTPGGKTKYLSELKAGDEVLIVDREGRSRTATICRVKIEWRPLLLIEADCDGRRIKTIVQNAETIRLMTEAGSRSVKELSKGDKVLVRLEEEGGRHFGTLVKEEKVIEV